MNLAASARSKLLIQGSEDLTQAQYEAITAPDVDVGTILRIHDEVFGGNLRKIPDKNLDFGPFLHDDAGVDGADPSNDAEDGGGEEFSGLGNPSPENLLTTVVS